MGGADWFPLPDTRPGMGMWPNSDFWDRMERCWALPWKVWGSWGKAIEWSVFYLPVDIAMSGGDARNCCRAVVRPQDEANNEDSRGERREEPQSILMMLSCSSIEPANYSVSWSDTLLSNHFEPRPFVICISKDPATRSDINEGKKPQTICMAKC